MDMTARQSQPPGRCRDEDAPPTQTHPLIERWIQYKEYNENRSQNTVALYRLYLERLAAWLAEQPPRGGDLLAVTPEQLERYTGLVLHQRKQRPPTRKVHVTAIRHFYYWCHRMRLIAEDPARDLPTPRAATRLPRPAQLRDAEKILMQPDLNTFVGLRDAAMLFVLAGTGCRVSGLTGLNEGDLIWTEGKAGTERLTIRLTEKGKKERMVPAPIEAALMIRAYLGHSALDEINRVLPNGDQVLFVNLTNSRVMAHEHYGETRRLLRHSVHNIIRNYGKQAGVPVNVCHAHALRHLYGTELAEEDVDLLMRKALLGHAKAETTEAYTHLAMRKMAEVVDKANPLGKMNLPVSDLAKQMRAMTRPLTR